MAMPIGLAVAAIFGMISPAMMMAKSVTTAIVKTAPALLGICNMSTEQTTKYKTFAVMFPMSNVIRTVRRWRTKYNAASAD